jgi:hypothetical protein
LKGKVKIVDWYSLLDLMKINKRKLAAQLEKLASKDEDLIIEKYEGSIAVSKNYSNIVNVRAVVDLDNGKIKMRSTMGILMMVLIIVSVVTVLGFVLIVAFYYFGLRPQYEKELRETLGKALERIKKKD